MRYLAALLVGGFGVLAGLAPAQEVGSLEWFRKAWVEADNWIPEEPLLIELRTIMRSRTTPAQLAEIQETVQDRPDHPLRRYLPLLEYDAAHPETTERYRYWIADKVWRGAVDRPSGHYSGNRDAAEGPRESWYASDGTLTVYQTDRPPHLRDVTSYRNELQMRVQLFLQNGFFGTSAGYEPVESSLDADGNWTGAVETRDGKWRTSFSGQLSDGGTILVEKSRTERTPHSAVSFDGFDVLEWGEFDGAPVPVRVQWREAQPGTFKLDEPFPIIVLDRIERTTSAKVHRAAAAPIEGVEDPVRGAFGGLVRDLRPGQMTRSVVSAEGTVSQEPVRVDLRPGQSPAWRVWGWVAGIAVVLGLLLCSWKLQVGPFRR